MAALEHVLYSVTSPPSSPNTANSYFSRCRPPQIYINFPSQSQQPLQATHRQRDCSGKTKHDFANYFQERSAQKSAWWGLNILQKGQNVEGSWASRGDKQGGRWKRTAWELEESWRGRLGGRAVLKIVSPRDSPLVSVPLKSAHPDPVILNESWFLRRVLTRIQIFKDRRYFLRSLSR